MSKQVRLLTIILLAIVSLPVGGCSSPQPTPTIGNLAPNFQLQTLDEQTISLFDLRGKLVLINFWATWCGPCRYEVPFLQQIHDDWSDKELVVLTIDAGENSATVQKFMTEFNLSLTVLMDTDIKVATAYSVTGIPTTFILDKNGIIRYKLVGSFRNKEAIENELSKIIP